ncbi:M48 family metalloprotease [Altererythrobacter sp. CC-YST694]|uniref:M48 family metalloprotease n=1 Tax=Altererythrobacter sp. CC-YST694 TaxID=2755038 RepID=UPI001D032A15|nr:M48 family metalloprotease [Altererythrobacter sp. CC-YST694]MCB5425439.1 M48 family metalloprotease [Altererythrobacter sp. CC-YST694]
MRAPIRILARLAALLAALQLAIQPAAAQSILRDAETEKLLQDMVDPLAEAAGLGRGAVEIVLVQDNSINAFVAGGQRIYIHSGLINAADTANEVQGVMAHELGHITGGHIIRSSEGISEATNITIVSLLLGVAAIAAGAGEAGMGILAAGQQAAMGKYLAFSRVQESSADAAAVDFLSKAGISGRGSIEFFKKLQNLEFRYGVSQDDEAGFSRTHPLTGDRITNLERDYQRDPAWNTPNNPQLEERFQRAKAKLYGYLAKPQDTLRAYPTTMTGIPARYARAYAYHKDAQVDKALTETRALIEADPQNPYFLELEGQILLESGRPRDALEPLREATRLTGNTPLIATTFGHALIATENQSNFEEAEQVLKAAVTKDRYNPFAWYQLGVVYAARGDMPRARLASAEQQSMSGQMAMALTSAEAAERGLPTGSPDWLRAQDIAMAAKAELERQKKRK